MQFFLQRLLCGLLSLGLIVVTGTQAATVDSLRCELLTNPVGIDESSPRLSWLPQSQTPGTRQTAYQIIVASSAENLARNMGDLWDSQKVSSAETFNIQYAGRPVKSNQPCFWKVRIWDERNTPSPWSAPASWQTGLLKPEEEWKAQWIGFDAPRAAAEAALSPTAPDAKTKPLLLPPSVSVRTEFQAPQQIRRATLHVAVLGLADVYLNGQRVYDDYFTSGWTDYTRRVYSRSYDVTKLVRRGGNALGATLADGWYCGYVGYKGERDLYGKNPRVRLQLHLEYSSGSTAVISTGPAWKAATGPALEADFLQGETYDARAAIAKWNETGFDDRDWKPVNTGAPVSPRLANHPAQPVRAISEFQAKSITEPTPGVYVLDLGQNFAGVPRLKVKGEAGKKIQLRFGERLNADGTLYTANLRSARATDTYICRGGGEPETWQPRFTFHGFQYVEISGLGYKPDADTVIGVALSSDTPLAGAFSCSEPMLNQLYNNLYWTQRMNFIDIPTDCPQRDERLGWTGDAQVYIRTATLNTDVEAFFDKWLVDLSDAQLSNGSYPKVAPRQVAKEEGGSAWADAGIICPWTLYEVYGDRKALARQYPGMVRFMEWYEKRSQPNRIPPAGFPTYGDWLSVGSNPPKDVLIVAYFARCAQIMAQAAEVLGNQEDAAKYQALFEEVKAAFNRAYVTADGHVKGDTQTSYALAITFDLLDAEKTKLAGDLLVHAVERSQWHISTGFIGTKDLMLALSKIDRNDVAYHLIFTDTYPSWGFSIKNGATSIWERWNGWTPENGFGDPKMNSFAHYSFGAVYQWMAENIGGIRNEGVAYDKIVIAPQMDAKLTRAKTHYDSIRGRIETDWIRQDGKLSLAVTIPPNTTATVFVPTSDAAAITAEGGDTKRLHQEPGVAVYTIASGKYIFHSTLQP